MLPESYFNNFLVKQDIDLKFSVGDFKCTSSRMLTIFPNSLMSITLRDVIEPLF